jgi:hypothetical protein
MLPRKIKRKRKKNDPIIDAFSRHGGGREMRREEEEEKDEEGRMVVPTLIL